MMLKTKIGTLKIIFVIYIIIYIHKIYTFVELVRSELAMSSCSQIARTLDIFEFLQQSFVMTQPALTRDSEDRVMQLSSSQLLLLSELCCCSPGIGGSS